MHRIIQAHLKSFSENFGYLSIEESIQFEKFCTFSVLSSRYSADFDLDEVTTGDGDDGIDGVAVVIDETPCPSPEEAEAIFKEPRRNHDVEVVFVQAKGGERFDLGDFLKFKEGILRYITTENYSANDDVLIDAKAAFDVVISNVPKVRNGRPSIFAYYITTGVYQNPTELERARKEFEQQLLDLGYFNEVEVRFLGRDELGPVDKVDSQISRSVIQDCFLGGSFGSRRPDRYGMADHRGVVAHRTRQEVPTVAR